LRGNSWRLTIKDLRRQSARLLAQNPDLRASLDAILEEAYGDALLIAQRETGLAEDAFPVTLPWTPEQVLQNEISHD